MAAGVLTRAAGRAAPADGLLRSQKQFFENGEAREGAKTAADSAPVSRVKTKKLELIS